MAWRMVTCGDPGPGDAHCTEPPYHEYSCYDATRDVSWNDGQFEMGWFDETPHCCDRTDCSGR